jgi:MFS family permease
MPPVELDAPEETMQASEGGVPWRRLLPTAFVPNLVYNIGLGAVVPIAPDFTLQLGGSLAYAAFVLAMLTVGQLAGTLSAGQLVTRFGETRTMLVAGVVGTGGGVLGLTAAAPGQLAAAFFLIGLAASAFALARHSFVTMTVAGAYRGRTMSVLAGCSRIGLLLGPFCAAAILATGGSLRTTFALPVAASALVAMLVVATRSLLAVDREGEPSRARIWQTVREYRGVLLTVGSGAALLQMVRTSRQVLIPIWGVTIGLSASQIALVVGFSAMLDVSLFYLGGVLMDRFGRLVVALPAFAAFGLAHLVMAMLGDLPDAAWWLTAVSLLLGAANGLTSGVNITMASDLADQQNPAAFLSAWRFVADTGPALAPLLIAATATVSLVLSTLLMAGAAAVGGCLMARYVPRYLPPADRA